MTLHVVATNPPHMEVVVTSSLNPAWSARLALSAAPADNRVDVIAHTREGALIVVTGTGRARPDIPPLPVGATAIAYISVPYMTWQITDDLITEIPQGWLRPHPDPDDLS